MFTFKQVGDAAAYAAGFTVGFFPGSIVGQVGALAVVWTAASATTVALVGIPTLYAWEGVMGLVPSSTSKKHGRTIVVEVLR